MIKKWNKHGWEVRCKIYSIMIFPTYLIRVVEILLEMIVNVYDTFIRWILWNLLNFLFKYRGGNEE